MKYYKSKICYLDNYKNLPIGELGINDIDYVNSEREFVFRKGLLPRSYYEYSTMMPIKDMVGVRYCAYTENHEWVFLLEKALQKEISVFIDVQEDDRFDLSLVNIVGFNKEELEIDFAYSRYSSYDSIYFKKNGYDLYVSRYKSCWYEEVLAGAYLVISKVYDELLKM